MNAFPQGLKPTFFEGLFSARLKSCPDTKRLRDVASSSCSAACEVSADLPGAFDAKRRESRGFAFSQDVLHDAVDAAATRAAAEACAQFVDVGFIAVGQYFHIAVFGVAHPAAEIELAGFAVHVPAEAYTLYSALNEEVKNHGFNLGQFCRLAWGRATEVQHCCAGAARALEFIYTGEHGLRPR